MRKAIKKILMLLFIAAPLAGLWYMVWIHGRLFYPRELEGCSVWVYNPERCELSAEAFAYMNEIAETYYKEEKVRRY